MSNRVGSLLPTVITLLAATVGPSAHPGESDNVVRGRFPKPPPDPKIWDVFVSYCEKDKTYWERIAIHLKPMRNKGVKIYDYNMIEPGAVIEDTTQSALLTSVVAVLLISADYLASDLMQSQLLDLLKQAEERGTRMLRLDVGTYDLVEWKRFTRYQRVGGTAAPLLNRLKEPKQDVIYVELLGAIRERLIECDRYPTPPTAGKPEGT
jgi:hypothetical protein